MNKEKIVEELLDSILKDIREILKEKLTEVLDKYLEDKKEETKTRKRERKEQGTIGFVEVGNKIYKLAYSIHLDKNKGFLFLFKRNKKLDVIGEFHRVGNELKWKLYNNKLKQIAKSEKINLQELEETINIRIHTKKDKLLDKLATLEAEQYETDANVIRLIEEEAINYIRENNKDYITEEEFKNICNKYGVDFKNIKPYLTSFYEKEPSKWYPIE